MKGADFVHGAFLRYVTLLFRKRDHVIEKKSAFGKLGYLSLPIRRDLLRLSEHRQDRNQEKCSHVRLFSLLPASPLVPLTLQQIRRIGLGLGGGLFLTALVLITDLPAKPAHKEETF